MSENGVRGQGALIERLDRAVRLESTADVAERVKADLAEAIRARALAVPERCRRPLATRYARRLLYRAPDGRYSVVVMTWGPGQGTPLHDHADTWCVEAVFEGEMEVTQFDLVQERGDLCRFEERSRVRAELGSSGCLIPPFQYHVLRNAYSDRTSLTVHVYGGEMRRCFVFEPRGDGWYQRRDRQLSYHD